MGLKDKEEKDFYTIPLPQIDKIVVDNESSNNNDNLGKKVNNKFGVVIIF